jgi:hypothetical protein
VYNSLLFGSNNSSDILKISDSITIVANKCEVIIVSNKNGYKIIVLRKIVGGEFVDIDTNSFNTKKIKIKNKKKKNKLSYTSDKYFYNVPISYWKPKHICQYIKSKFKSVYHSIPLELQWDDTGWTENSTSRSRCWAYAKHLIDKFVKIGINKERLKDYIDWSFENQKNITPSMGLLSSNNWIDQYYFKNKRKRIQTNYNDKKESQIWNSIVKRSNYE